MTTFFRLRLAAAAALALLPSTVFAAATVTIDASNNLTYAGSAVANQLTVSYASGVYTFADTAEVISVTNGGTSVVVGNGTNTVTVTLVASIAINGNGGSDVIRLHSSSAITISIDTAIGVPDDTIIGNGTTAAVLGTVSVDDSGGIGYLAVDDAADTTARTVTVSATQITGLTAIPIGVYTNNVVTMTVTTGSGTDAFTTVGPAPSYPGDLWLNGGDGADQFDIAALAGWGQHVAGGNPPPPASPGDTLAVDLAAVASPSITVAGTPSGFEGSWSFTGGSVAFSQVESYTPRVATQLWLVSGSPQSAVVGAAFAAPLLVRVLDQADQPVSGVAVQFTAPASGPAATLSSPALTDANGESQVTATANSQAGSYEVVALASGVTGTAVFALDNLEVEIPLLGGVGLAALAALLAATAALALARRVGAA